MTRFIGEAVGQRSGRSKGTNLRKEMEGKQHRAFALNYASSRLTGQVFAEFQKTGRHAELVQASAAERVPALPERDMNRPHVFLDLKQGSKLLGTLASVTPGSLWHKVCVLAVVHSVSLPAYNEGSEDSSHAAPV